MSLDGYLAGPAQHVDEEVSAFINEEMRRYGIEIDGRRMYDALLYWETYEARGGASSEHEDAFARLWKELDKVVISSTLEGVSSGSTRLVRTFRPDDVRRLKAASTRDLSVSGPTLAALVTDEKASMATRCASRRCATRRREDRRCNEPPRT